MEIEDRASGALTCAECGATLPMGVKVCERCSPPSVGTFQAGRPERALVRSLRGHIFVGIAMVPWIFAPLALQKALNVLVELQRRGSTDPEVWKQARRLRNLALLVTILAYGITGFLLWYLRGLESE
jgi:ABC-type dipeptide/oligopeptide/nickel transport system permease component